MVCLQSRRPRVGAAAAALYLSGSPHSLGLNTGTPSSPETGTSSLRLRIASSLPCYHCICCCRTPAFWLLGRANVLRESEVLSALLPRAGEQLDGQHFVHHSRKRNKSSVARVRLHPVTRVNLHAGGPFGKVASDACESPGLFVPARMRANTDAGPRAPKALWIC